MTGVSKSHNKAETFKGFQRESTIMDFVQMIKLGKRQKYKIH